MDDPFSPSKYGAQKNSECSSDADCRTNEKCVNKKCSDPCVPNPCPDQEICVNEANGNFSCIECTENRQCPDLKICKNGFCADPCSDNPCSATGEVCSARNGHSYICYGCSNDTACPDGQFCDANAGECKNLCPDACPHQLCSIEKAHQTKCSGCTDDEGCEEGQTCDLETNQCIAADCGSILLASRDDVTIIRNLEDWKNAIRQQSRTPFTVVMNDIDITGFLWSPTRLLGPKYFSDIPACKISDTPTITVTNYNPLQSLSIYNLKINANVLHALFLKDVEILGDHEFRIQSQQVRVHGTSHLGRVWISGGRPNGLITRGDVYVSSIISEGGIIGSESSETRLFFEPRNGQDMELSLRNTEVDTTIIMDQNAKADIYLSGSTLSLYENGNILSGRITMRDNSTVNIKGSTFIKTSDAVFFYEDEHSNKSTYQTVNIEAPLSVSKGGGVLFNGIDGININSTLSAGGRGLGHGYDIKIGGNGSILNLGGASSPKYIFCPFYNVEYEAGTKLESGGICKKSLSGRKNYSSSHCGDDTFNIINSDFSLPCD